MIATMRIFLIATLLLCFSGCAHQYETKITVNIGIACDSTTTELEQHYILPKENGSNVDHETACVDKRFIFNNLDIYKIKISHLKEFDSYDLLLFFHRKQLTVLNAFIDQHLYKRNYIISNNGIINPDTYSTFSSDLDRPILYISFSSKFDAEQFRTLILSTSGRR